MNLLLNSISILNWTFCNKFLISINLFILFALLFSKLWKLFDISNNFGDTKSLVTHPTTTTHRVLGEEGREKLSITNNMVRLSIGLEDVEDLIQDLSMALEF